MQIHPKQVSQILTKNSLGELTSLDKFSTGIVNPIYLINRKYVLRVEEHRYEHNPEKLKRESALLKILLKFNLPVPQVICFDGSEEIIKAPFILLSFIKGKALLKAFSSLNLEQQKRVSYQLGALAKQIHSVPLKDLKDIHFNDNVETWVKRNIKDFENYWKVVGNKFYLSNNTQQQVFTNFERYKKLNFNNIGNLVHGDFASSNFQVDNGKIVGVFDFEYANIGDPLWDLQKLPYSFKLGPEFSRAEFLKGYGIKEFTEEEKIRLKMYCLHQGVWEIWATVTKFMPFGDKEIKEGKDLIKGTLLYDKLLT